MKSYKRYEIYNDDGEKNIWQIHISGLSCISFKRWCCKPKHTKAFEISINNNNKSYKEYILHADSFHTIHGARKGRVRKYLLETGKTYHNELFENNKYSVFNIWKHLNHIINPRKTSIRTVINKPVHLYMGITNKQDVSDTMNEHFCDIVVTLLSELRDFGHPFPEYLPSRINYSFYLFNS